MLAVCVFNEPFADDLQKGKAYPILTIELSRLKVEVCNDKDEIAWYPAECFDILAEVLSYARYPLPKKRW